MKKKWYYVKNERPRLPILSTVSYWVALDYFHAPGWMWGAVGLIMIVAWVVGIFGILFAQGVDLFDKDDSLPKVKSSFRERLTELANKRNGGQSA